MGINPVYSRELCVYYTAQRQYGKEISHTCPWQVALTTYSLSAEADDRLYNCVTQVPGQCAILPRQYSYPLGTYIMGT